MSDLAYDISYLLESGPATATAAVPALLRVASSAPAAPVPLGVAAAQAALARELLQVAEVHEEWIRQYLHTQSSAQGSP
jgi:di/tricarboxylate transporter